MWSISFKKNNYSPPPHCPIAHGIYLDRAGLDLLLERGAHVALCARSNATLGLAEAPVAPYLNEGHDIAVGTDSLSSCPLIDVMDDVKLLTEIAARQGYVESDLSARLMHAVTMGDALALRMVGEGYGALVPGGPTDIALFDLQVQDESGSANAEWSGELLIDCS